METSIFQYDQEAHEWALHEDGYDEGIQQGIQQQKLEYAETISRYQNQIATMQKELETLRARSGVKTNQSSDNHS